MALWRKTLRSPIPAPSPASTSEDEITQLEEAFHDARQTVGAMGREVASIQRMMDIRGREISECAKIRELDELHRTIESLRHRVDVRDSDTIGTPSYEHERQPVPMYYGKRKDLSAFLNVFLNWACPKTSKQH